ncbi:MAG: ubiquitin-specific protease doa4 [Caeruleum heppii]|nr:MAG: ubiquitin-specific protease doa4 [Caeruleum heppii]
MADIVSKLNGLPPVPHRDVGPMNRGGGRVYAHLDDLVASSIPQLDVHAPLRTLLVKAEISAKQADTHLDFRRPDIAYVEYLTAFSILVDLIPRHKDFPSLSSGRSELSRLNKDLQKRINAQHDKFDKVRELIKDDNARSGIRPTLSASRREFSPVNPVPNGYNFLHLPHGHGDSPNSANGPDQPRSHAVLHDNDTSTSPHVSQSPPSNLLALGPRRKPPVSPKPEKLHGRSIAPDPRQDGAAAISNGVDALAERFARLRTADSGQTPNRDPSGHPSHLSSSQSPSTFTVNQQQHTESQNTPETNISQSPTMARETSDRLLGPRPMPNGSAAPPHPPKIPLASNIAAMPRAPSPTYDPTRNPPKPGSTRQPWANSRPISVPDPRDLMSTSPSSSSVRRRPVNGQSQVHPPAPPESRHRPQSNPQRHLNLPSESSISANKLYEVLNQGSDRISVLLIDVRSRIDFDEGHIFAPSTICIEPIQLRVDMSAEQIQETLVLSPENEQALFNRRQQFDLVVYYDQSSAATKTPTSMGNAAANPLRALHQAIFDFSYDKVLQRSPVMLVGGLNAWTDLVGAQALKSTNTAGVEGGQPGQLKRSSAHRRRREYQPLDAEEEQAWRQRVQSEGSKSFDAPSSSPAVSADGTTSSTTVADVSPAGGDEAEFVRTYDDFLRRFPEPSEMQESMVSPNTPRNREATMPDPATYNLAIRSRSAQAVARPEPLERLPPSAPSRPAPAVPRPSYSGVSSRETYPAAASSTASPLSPKLPSHAETISARHDGRIGRTGLTNFGATCYMNSVIQCLGATLPLREYFLSGGYKRDVRRNKWGSNGVLPEVYYNLMWHLWNGQFDFIAPKTFREFIARLNKTFSDPHVQHDANDFFVFLVDALHEDLNVNFDRTRLNDLTPAEERRREDMPPQVASRVEWNRWCHRNSSWISRMFTGQHLSRLRCTACGFRSTSYETFNSISLEIPKKGSAHVHDCLENYTREERLSAEDCWTCPDCKVPREALKKITITRAPHILVLQLKRFKSERRGVTTKSTTFVDFPLARLDLSPYTVGPLAPDLDDEARRRYGPAILAPDPTTTPPYDYDAFGVVQHFGTLTGGHYTSLIRAPSRAGQWLEFNDRSVKEFDPRKVPSPAAYLLFYVRANVQ